MSCSAPSDKTLWAIKMAFRILIAKSSSPQELTHEHLRKKRLGIIIPGLFFVAQINELGTCSFNLLTISLGYVL